MLVHYLIREYTVNIPSYVLSGCDQDSNNVQRFSLDSNNNGFSLSSFFLSHLSFLWIGAQFPQEKVLSYGRILTLHYYFLLMCILFSIPSKGNSLELVSSFQECPQGLQFSSSMSGVTTSSLSLA